MREIKIPVGRSGFADIRRNGYYYIDKSGLIEALLKTDATQATLITRPRRFGKTLGMSMLAEFFDIRKDSADLFSGLAVSENENLCKMWMNQYPTVFVSFRSVEGMHFDGAYAMLSSVIAQLYKEHLYLLDSVNVNMYDRKAFDRIASETAERPELENSLLILTKMLSEHFGKPVILLLDEYDVPLAKASDKGYYAEMLDMMKGVMRVIKDNDALKFAVITGCLRIAKESVFTGTTNLVSDTISDTRLNEYFGFTQSEVDRLLTDTGLQGYGREMKEWYDGYRFGEVDVYCPWDVVNYVQDLMLDPRTEPSGYWKNSSDNAIIRSFIDELGTSITESFEKLLAGECIVQQIRDDMTYDYLHSSGDRKTIEDNFWSVLYLTGYLTKGQEAEPTGREYLPKGSMRLKIPNKEIKEIFESTIATWFKESSQKWDRSVLFSSVWNGDGEKVAEELNRLLRQTISYHDYKEDFYHAFFAGVFAGAGYSVKSNREYGEGRSDIVVQDYAGDRMAVFEVKYARSRADLQASCEKAIPQIRERGYAEELEEDYAQVLCYGISFFKKRCFVKRLQK
ncbi:MAG: AAA family ATPase [Eubacteriales bacterium]|nr:AAA family ATPase [Eubacteriales bacterium]